MNIDTDNEIEKIVKEAKMAKSKELDYGVSKSKRIKGIKNNRAVEKEINREKERFKIGEEPKNAAKVSEVIKLSNTNKKSEEKNDTGKNKIMEMLKKKRDERREK